MILKGKTFSPWIDHLPFNWDSILQRGLEIKLKSNTHIYQAGDCNDFIYLVKEGRVRIYLTSHEGKEQTMYIVGENGTFGDSRQSYDIYENAITVSNTKLLRFQKSLFKELIFTNSTFTAQWVSIAERKIQVLAQSNLQLACYSSLERCCSALFHLANTYGVKEDGGVTINILFTHQELAGVIGTSRVTVVNLLQQLMNKEVIKKINKHYHIPDINKLRIF